MTAGIIPRIDTVFGPRRDSALPYTASEIEQPRLERRHTLPPLCLRRLFTQTGDNATWPIDATVRLRQAGANTLLHPPRFAAAADPVRNMQCGRVLWSGMAPPLKGEDSAGIDLPFQGRRYPFLIGRYMGPRFHALLISSSERPFVSGMYFHTSATSNTQHAA